MSLFFVMFAAIVLIVAGLVIDGGNAIAGRQRAADEAEQAARAGANQISVLALRNNGGCPVIDKAAAHSAIVSFVGATHDQLLAVSYPNARSVRVQVQTTTQLPLLGLIGFHSISTKADATAAAVTGGQGTQCS